MATALDRIMSLVDQTIDQVESGQEVDVHRLNQRLTLETVRAGLEFVNEADQRSREADEQLTRSG
jgi:hypothetical protein